MFKVQVSGQVMSRGGVWAAIVTDTDSGESRELSGRKLHTTSLEIQVFGALQALKRVGDGSEVIVELNGSALNWLQNPDEACPYPELDWMRELIADRAKERGIQVEYHGKAGDPFLR